MVTFGDALANSEHGSTVGDLELDEALGLGMGGRHSSMEDLVGSFRHSKRHTPSKRFSVIRSTEEHFQTTDVEAYGAYGHIRKTLDYSFHAHYSKARQWLHDSIIEEYLAQDHGDSDEQPENSVPQNPWLILTAGVQGAGKRRSVDELVKTGLLSLLPYVFVDTDEIRRFLPEYESYLEDSPDMIDKFTQKECGYIAETLTLAALQAGRNVFLDSALQDVMWYKDYLARLREEFPCMKIGLIHVDASLDNILQRVKHRARETSRTLPEDKIREIFASIEDSVYFIEQNVDYVCRITNNDGTPLEITADGGWDHFREVFDQASSFNIAFKLERYESEDPRSLSRCKKGRHRRRFSVLVSSEQNHASNDNKFYGPYAHIRKTLDYSYHQNYTFERQHFQNAIVNEFLSNTLITDRNGDMCTTPTEPWIVFTAGPMGAGKSYTMKNLVERDLFPLLAFVRVDPDEIRRFLPEFHLYVESSPDLAGELTRKEAGFITEILTLAALQQGKNVLLDGSLRDADWYAGYFERLRREFKNLRLAIVQVTAPRDVVFARAAERGMTTGRIVPRDVLAASYEQVPKSVRILSPLVDYHVTLSNAPDTGIQLVEPPGETWKSFSKNWLQTCAWVPAKERMLKVSSKISMNNLKEA